MQHYKRSTHTAHTSSMGEVSGIGCRATTRLRVAKQGGDQSLPNLQADKGPTREAQAYDAALFFSRDANIAQVSGATQETSTARQRLCAICLQKGTAPAARCCCRLLGAPARVTAAVTAVNCPADAAELVFLVALAFPIHTAGVPHVITLRPCGCGHGAPGAHGAHCPNVGLAALACISWPRTRVGCPPSSA